MIIKRTQNAVRNMVTGTVLKLYQILCPFAIRTVFIYTLGMNYLGLNSLFASILQVLNIAELGVGSAMVYSMYKPITEDDTSTICALMKLYKIYYRIIGTVILVVGIIITPFIPKMISGEVPADINIYVLYYINLLTTVFSYWLFAYKNSLLQAHQRLDVVNNIALFTNTVQYIVQVVILVLAKNYYLYILTALFIQLVTNIVTAIVATKMYPEYKAGGELDKSQVKKINGRVKDLFTNKVGGVIVNSADSIVISAFLGLTVLAVYNNYWYIMTSVIGFIAVIFNSCTAGIGNSIIVETNEKNFNDFKSFLFIIMWIVGICGSCFVCLYQPFMYVWIGEDGLLPFGVVVCLYFYFAIYEINQLCVTYKDAAGIWHQDRFRPLITGIINLILNLITVRFIGVFGIILSTVVSTAFVGLPWILKNLFDNLFTEDAKEDASTFFKRIILYLTIDCGMTAFCYIICWLLLQEYDVVNLILRALIAVIMPNIILWLFYHSTEEYHFMKKLALKIIKRH